MKKGNAIAIGVICVLIGGSQVNAARRTTGLSPLDKTFLEDTSRSNLGELAMKRVVDAHATDTHDKQFAARMVRDHRKAQGELASLAMRVNYDLPRGVDKTEKQAMARLRHEPRSRFAAAYKSVMVNDHAGDIAKTKMEISLGRNPRVKAFARKMLVVLQNHLRMARALPGNS